ncbi:hypothetical protein [Veillonella magna]|uniref:hypothetical protein n=1 Tax=Veillonella magna TaxID=464322 RepID=UPI00041D8BDB|nr:hypothetical protein [Veillonella magna]
MLTEILVTGMVIKGIRDINTSCNLDEEARQKYMKAFKRSAEAENALEKKREKLEKRLKNVIRKKEAIIEYTVPEFSEVYGVIQKVNIKNTNNTNNNLPILTISDIQEINNLNSMSISLTKGVSDMAALGELLLYGSGAMVKDSERYLSAARSQNRMANVACEQAKNMETVLDAIISRADRIANLLVGLNQLFTLSIEEAKRIISNNGTDVQQYNDYDKHVLMTCVNIAKAVADSIKIPVLDKNGKVAKEALCMIKTGEVYLSKLKELNQFL